MEETDDAEDYFMRIATWNVERLKHKKNLDKIIACCEDAKADILVLTETDQRIRLPYPYRIETLPAQDACPGSYRHSENRVTIYSKYELVKVYPTYDKYTAVCAELKTERGSLIVYGTIMGILGNREASYQQDLREQIRDIRYLSGRGNVCVAGDYNCSFSDNYYFTKEGRNILNTCFQEEKMTVLTADTEECIDHIAISDSFIQNGRIAVEEWNFDKSLSDHKGIAVTI